MGITRTAADGAAADGTRPVLPPTGRGRRTRAKLLNAARSVFETNSFEQSKVTDITKAAGVSTGTFYTYFETKEEVFREIAAGVLAEMQAAPKRRPDDPTDERAAIAAANRRYFEVCLDNVRMARSIEELAGSDAGVATARRTSVLGGVARAERWLHRLQADGRCDPDLDAWAMALTLHTMTVRIAYDHLLHPGGADDLDRITDVVTQIWVRAIGLK